jgi:xanthine dehydrogenase accessory factor
VKSHNYGRDFAALCQLLKLDLLYVGLLGPRKRRDQLLNAVLDEGIAIDADVFAPAGLDLGAETPEELALALVAEIQATFAGASAESLRHRKAPIHGWNLVRRPAVPEKECATSAP